MPMSLFFTTFSGETEHTSDKKIFCMVLSTVTHKLLNTIYKPSNWLELYSTEYYQLLTSESCFINLEQTPLNRSQPLPYQLLTKDLLMNWSKLVILKVPGKTGRLTNNTTVIILTRDRSKGASFLWSSYLLLILLIFNYYYYLLQFNCYS